MALRWAGVRWFALLLVGLVCACGEPVGSPCQIVGDGFHARDACAHRCLSRWSITCPGGEAVVPGVCSGDFGCSPGSCPSGQVCYHDNDPFDDRSYCLPADVCGAQSADVLTRWERRTLDRQEEIRAARRAPPALRAKPVPTAPAETTQAPAIGQVVTSPPISPVPPELPCEADAQRDVFFVGPSAVRRGDRFTQDLPFGWRFVLEPQSAGWRIVLQDRPERAGAVDLSSVTPPLHGLSARDIAGWHFRDRRNLGPNRGDVNAPQHLRLFSFEPELIGTGGVRGVLEGSGRGWLRMGAMTLSPPAAGQQAHIEQMRFEACLTWLRADSKTVQRWRTALASSREALRHNHPQQADTALLERCGLNLSRFSVRSDLPAQALDIDGDGTSDLAAFVESDGGAAIALCRGGEVLVLLDERSETIRDATPVPLFSAIERWYSVPGDRGAFGYVDEPAWPRMDGEALMLERLEKSLHALYWRDGAVRLHRVYRYVEP